MRERVELKLEVIVRRVKVNRSLTPKQVIEETGGVTWYSNRVLVDMPTGKGEEVDVYFFKLKRYLQVREYEPELAKYGLVPDPRAQAAVNRDDPSFVEEHPNGVQWGGTAYTTFRSHDGVLTVTVDRNDLGWSGDWWLGGVRK